MAFFPCGVHLEIKSLTLDLLAHPLTLHIQPLYTHVQLSHVQTIPPTPTHLLIRPRKTPTPPHKLDQKPKNPQPSDLTRPRHHCTIMPNPRHATHASTHNHPNSKPPIRSTHSHPNSHRTRPTPHDPSINPQPPNPANPQPPKLQTTNPINP